MVRPAVRNRAKVLNGDPVIVDPGEALCRKPALAPIAFNYSRNCMA